MKPPFVRSPYNYDTKQHSDDTGLACPEPTLTQQQFLEESDINFIAERFGLTGEMPQVLKLPAYGDFEGIYDFQSAQNQVREAETSFMTLPAKVRARFNNNPQQLLEFVEDEANREEAIFMGLVKRPEVEPQSPPAAPQPAGKGDTPTPP